MFGDNVVTSLGDTWKRHRRITAPSFNHSTYKNVWNTTVRVYADMIAREGWRNVDETPVININNVTHKVSRHSHYLTDHHNEFAFLQLALFLIAIVGFGIPMSWDEPPRDKDGRLSIQKMIFDVATYIMERGITPKWVYKLGFEKLKQIDEAYVRFEEFMYERIAEREAELRKIRAMGANEADLADSLNSIFGRLVNARLSEGKNSLSDREILGNCFAFVSHDTFLSS